MKILRLLASFGNLNNYKLELKDGLNIIEAANEAGKTTWCAFIRTMLYGINTSDRDKTGYLADKTRYRPWSGVDMQGTMDVEAGGQRITLERSAQNSYPMKKFTARYTGTGEIVENLTGDSAGEALTGVPEQVFVRTSFIKQAAIRIDQTSELEKLISSIVTTGDEQTSFTDSNDKLRAWQRLRRYKNSGTLPRLEAELNKANENLRQLETATENLSEIHQELQRLEKRRDQLILDLEIHDKLELRNLHRKLDTARKNAEHAENEVANINLALSKYGENVTHENIIECRAAIGALSSIKSSLTDARNIRDKAQLDFEQKHDKKSGSKLSSYSEAVLAEKVRLASEYERLSQNKPKQPLFSKSNIMLMIGIAAAILAMVLLSGAIVFFIPGLILSAAFFAVCLFLLIRNIKAPKPEGAQLAALLAEFGVNNADALNSAFAEYQNICLEEETAKINLSAAEQSLAAAEKAAQAAKDAVLEPAHLLLRDIDDFSTIISKLDELDALLGRKARAEFETLAMRQMYSDLLAEYADLPEETDTSYLIPPLRDKHDTAVILESTKAQIEKLAEQYNIARGGIHALGDPVIISGEISALKEQIADQSMQYEALSLALDTLNDANVEMQTRFSPIIGSEAEKIMQQLTANRYEKLIFDKSFDALAKSADDTVSRNVLSLSKGTTDQLYLSLRLAMCLLLDSNEPSPIILDDALVNFDNVRAAAALDYLYRLSKDRQIILLTCHSREGEYFKNDKSVNYIKL